MRCTACRKQCETSPVSLAGNIHENLCPECKGAWTTWAKHMGCPRQPALSLVFFRRWQQGARRAA